jgi:hypothetical protein
MLRSLDDGAVKLPIAVAEPAHVIDERILKTCRIVASNNGSGNGLIAFGLGPRGAEADWAMEPSAASSCGFLVGGAQKCQSRGHRFDPVLGAGNYLTHP